MFLIGNNCFSLHKLEPIFIFFVWMFGINSHFVHFKLNNYLMKAGIGSVGFHFRDIWAKQGHLNAWIFSLIDIH